ncbi:hypothetical protein L9F63_028156, partial [Diploptera punctata]
INTAVVLRLEVPRRSVCVVTGIKKSPFIARMFSKICSYWVELRLTTSSCDSVDLVPVDNLNTNSRLIHKGNDKFLRERKHEPESFMD